MTGLGKLPDFEGVCWRGYNHGTKGEILKEYKIGRPIQWGAFTSVTTRSVHSKPLSLMIVPQNVCVQQQTRLTAYNYRLLLAVWMRRNLSHPAPASSLRSTSLLDATSTPTPSFQTRVKSCSRRRTALRSPASRERRVATPSSTWCRSQATRLCLKVSNEVLVQICQLNMCCLRS
jgi:hypothetical protein